MGRTVGWILGLGVVAVAAIAVASWLIGGSASVDAGTDPAGAVPPMTAPDGPAEPVAADRIRVAASSFLAERNGITYAPGNTIDGDLGTAWNSATDAGAQGQVLTYRFAEPVSVSAIRFVNGYAKNAEVYRSNHRIRDVVIRTDATEQLVTLLDTSDRQEISFEFGYTSKVELEVLEIYPGEGFTDSTLSADLALSEIEFLAAQRQG